MLGKAVLRALSDTGPRQSMQIEVTKGELIDDVERMQQYGMSSVPPISGTDCLVAFLGGDREQGIIIAAENRKLRVKGLKSGEVAIYDDLGNVVLLGRDQLSVTGKTKVVVTAPEVDLAAGASAIKMTAAGVAITSTVLTHNGINIGATHTHGGVQNGNGNTLVPNP